MGINVNVINWEELSASLEDKINVEISGDVNVDFKPVQDVLERYLPEIKALIQAIVNGQVKEGRCRVKGESIHLKEAATINLMLNTEKSVAISGLTYWQSRFSSLDTYDLLILGENGYITLLEGLYPKDFAETKKISPAVPVPEGCTAVVRIHHGGDHEMDVCVDFEYVELEGG